MPDCWPIANSTTCSACRTVEDRLPSFECSLVRIASSGTHSASRTNRTASLGLSFAVGCGQSLAHTMRSGATLMYARADLGVMIGARQLDPGPSPVDELADRLEARIVQGIGLCQPAEMIEHVRGGHAQQQVLDSRDLLAFLSMRQVRTMRRRLRLSLTAGAESGTRRKAALNQVCP